MEKSRKLDAGRRALSDWQGDKYFGRPTLIFWASGGHLLNFFDVMMTWTKCRNQNFGRRVTRNGGCQWWDSSVVSAHDMYIGISLISQLRHWAHFLHVDGTASRWFDFKGWGCQRAGAIRAIWDDMTCHSESYPTKQCKLHCLGKSVGVEGFFLRHSPARYYLVDHWAGNCIQVFVL